MFSIFFWGKVPQLSSDFPNGLWTFERQQGQRKLPGNSDISEEEEAEVEALQVARGSEEVGTEREQQWKGDGGK